jgi:SAM-dependent methyltransferase
VVNPVLVFYRTVFEEQLLRLLPASGRVVDLCGGVGETALLLAERGFSVHALAGENKQTMRLRNGAMSYGPGAGRLIVESRRRVDLSFLLGEADAAYAFPDTLERHELPELSRQLARALRKGGLALLTLPGRRAGFDRIQRRSVLFPATARDIPLFWRPYCGLGWLMPGPGSAAWAQSHPQTFGCLAAIDGLFRRVPFIRRWGRYTLWLGVRA